MSTSRTILLASFSILDQFRSIISWEFVICKRTNISRTSNSKYNNCIAERTVRAGCMIFIMLNMNTNQMFICVSTCFSKGQRIYTNI